MTEMTEIDDILKEVDDQIREINVLENIRRQDRFVATQEDWAKVYLAAILLCGAAHLSGLLIGNVPHSDAFTGPDYCALLLLVVVGSVAKEYQDKSTS